MKECLTACRFWSEIKDVEVLLTRYMEMKLVAKVRLVGVTLQLVWARCVKTAERCLALIASGGRRRGCRMSSRCSTGTTSRVAATPSKRTNTGRPPRILRIKCRRL